MNRLTTSILCGVLLVLAYAWSAALLSHIAAIEGIHDERAGQVISMLAVWLAAMWVVAVVTVLRGTASDQPRVLAGVAGMACGTSMSGVVLALIAMLSAIVVTPPAAWLIMTMAGALFGVWLAMAAGNGPGAAAVPDA